MKLLTILRLLIKWMGILCYLYDCYRFGTEKRVLFKTNDRPGPGTYDTSDNGLSYVPTLLW